MYIRPAKCEKIVQPIAMPEHQIITTIMSKDRLPWSSESEIERPTRAYIRLMVR